MEKIDDNVDRTIMEKILLDLLNDKEISLDLSSNKEIDGLFDVLCDGSNELEIILSKDMDHNYTLRLKTRDQEGHKLLDDLWKDIGCMYLSDLKNKEFSLMIKLYLNKIKLNKYSLADWNDTINYLTFIANYEPDGYYPLNYQTPEEDEVHIKNKGYVDYENYISQSEIINIDTKRTYSVTA